MDNLKARLSSLICVTYLTTIVSCGNQPVDQRSQPSLQIDCPLALDCIEHDDATAKIPSEKKPPEKIAKKDTAASLPDQGTMPDEVMTAPEINPNKPELEPQPEQLAFKGSKLGLHILGFSVSNETRTMLSACPRIAKWMAGYGSNYISDFKAQCPDSIIVLRPYVSPSDAHYDASSDATVIRNQALNYWQFMQADLQKFGIDKKQIDWLEGPNELDNLPDWYHDYKNAEWFARFWDVLADLIHDAGYKPLVGSIAGGNPSMAGDLKDAQGKSLPNAMLPLANVIKSKAYPIAWSYHGYTRFLSKSESDEKWYSLRYRTIVQQTGLEGVPLLLTEGGQDFPKGWLYHEPSRGEIPSPEQYMDWLAWYDQQIRQDSQVLGVTLYQIGNFSDWASFDLTPIASLFKSYIENHRQ